MERIVAVSSLLAHRRLFQLVCRNQNQNVVATVNRLRCPLQVNYLTTDSSSSKTAISTPTLKEHKKSKSRKSVAQIKVDKSPAERLTDPAISMTKTATIPSQVPNTELDQPNNLQEVMSGIDSINAELVRTYPPYRAQVARWLRENTKLAEDPILIQKLIDSPAAHRLKNVIREWLIKYFKILSADSSGSSHALEEVCDLLTRCESLRLFEDSSTSRHPLVGATIVIFEKEFQQNPEKSAPYLPRILNLLSTGAEEFARSSSLQPFHTCCNSLLASHDWAFGSVSFSENASFLYGILKQRRLIVPLELRAAFLQPLNNEYSEKALPLASANELGKVMYNAGRLYEIQNNSIDVATKSYLFGEITRLAPEFNASSLRNVIYGLKLLRVNSCPKDVRDILVQEIAKHLENFSSKETGSVVNCAEVIGLDLPKELRSTFQLRHELRETAWTSYRSRDRLSSTAVTTLNQNSDSEKQNHEVAVASGSGSGYSPAQVEQFITLFFRENRQQSKEEFLQFIEFMSSEVQWSAVTNAHFERIMSALYNHGITWDDMKDADRQPLANRLVLCGSVRQPLKLFYYFNMLRIRIADDATQSQGIPAAVKEHALKLLRSLTDEEIITNITLLLQLSLPDDFRRRMYDVLVSSDSLRLCTACVGKLANLPGVRFQPWRDLDSFTTSNFSTWLLTKILVPSSQIDWHRFDELVKAFAVLSMDSLDRSLPSADKQTAKTENAKVQALISIHQKLFERYPQLASQSEVPTPGLRYMLELLNTLPKNTLRKITQEKDNATFLSLLSSTRLSHLREVDEKEGAKEAGNEKPVLPRVLQELCSSLQQTDPKLQFVPKFEGLPTSSFSVNLAVRRAKNGKPIAFLVLDRDSAYIFDGVSNHKVLVLRERFKEYLYQRNYPKVPFIRVNRQELESQPDKVKDSIAEKLKAK